MNIMKQISATLLLLCLVTFSYAQGEGCATAMAITPGSFTADGPSTGGMANQPTANHADWYSFTPTQSGLMSINSCGGGADTRVYVYSGACGSLTQIATNDDFCDIGNGVDEFASEVENVILLAGVTYYIEWDDRWYLDDPAILHPAFDFTMDFFAASANDGALLSSLVPFYQIPESQVPAAGIPLSVSVANLGFEASTNVTVSVDIQDANGANIFTNTPAPISSIAPFDVSNEVTVLWPGTIGSYTVCYSIAIDETDGDAGNDQLCHPLVISQTTYGIDDPTEEIGALGIDGPGVVDLGQSFFIYETDVMTSISAFIGGGAAGDNLQYQVFEINADAVGAMVYNSGPTTIVSAGQGWTHHVMTTPLTVNAGQKYMVSIRHNDTGTNTGLGTSTSIYTPNNAWIRANDGAWSHPEIFSFNVAYLIRANLGTGTPTCTVSVDMKNETVAAGGVSIAYWNSAGTMVTNPCSDNGDGTWSCQFTGTALDTGGYLFVNGATNEVVPMDCGMDPGVGFNYRPVSLVFEDDEKSTVCFSNCADCPILVNFQVNMNAVIDAGLLSPNGVHIMGDFNAFDPAVSEMLDTDNDGIYEFTQGLLEGEVQQFRYVNGNTLGADESEITAMCGVDGGAGVFNRVWTVGAQNESTDPWCFNECLLNCTEIISVNEVAFESGLSIFPNPTSRHTVISYNFPEALDLNVRMTNSIGQLVYDNTINNAFTGNVEVDVNDFAPGVYFVTMSDGENLVTKKLFVEK